MTAVTFIRLLLLWEAAGWGLVLSRPARTFDLSVAYGGMAAVGPEDAWASLFGAFAALLVATWWSRWPRVGVMILLGMLHAWLALSFGRHSGWVSPGVVSQSAFMLASWWLLGEDARAASDA